MRAILLLSVLIILIAGFGMFVSVYDHNSGNIKETFSELISWPNPSYLKEVTAQDAYLTETQPALRQTIGYAYILIVGLFLLNYCMCMIAKEYYSQKRGKEGARKMLRLLNIVILLQILGFICSFFQYKVLDNLINLQVDDAGAAYIVIAIIKYASWGFGFLIGLYALINSIFFIKDKTYEYKVYTKNYLQMLKSKAIQKMDMTVKNKQNSK